MEQNGGFIPEKWKEPFGIEADLLNEVSPLFHSNLTAEECLEKAQGLLKECAEQNPYIGREVNFLLLDDQAVLVTSDEGAETRKLIWGDYHAEVYGFCPIVDCYVEDRAPRYELGVYMGISQDGIEPIEAVLPFSAIRNVELSDRNDLFFYEKGLFKQMLPSLRAEYEDRLDDTSLLIEQVDDDESTLSLAMSFLNRASRLKQAYVGLIFDHVIEYEYIGDDPDDDFIGPALLCTEGEVVGFTIGFASHPGLVSGSRLQPMVLLKDEFEQQDGLIGSRTMVLPLNSLATAEVLSSPHYN